MRHSILLLILFFTTNGIAQTILRSPITLQEEVPAFPKEDVIQELILTFQNTNMTGHLEGGRECSLNLLIEKEGQDLTLQMLITKTTEELLEEKKSLKEKLERLNSPEEKISNEVSSVSKVEKIINLKIQQSNPYSSIASLSTIDIDPTKTRKLSLTLTEPKAFVSAQSQMKFILYQAIIDIDQESQKVKSVWLLEMAELNDDRPAARCILD